MALPCDNSCTPSNNAVAHPLMSKVALGVRSTGELRRRGASGLPPLSGGPHHVVWHTGPTYAPCWRSAAHRPRSFLTAESAFCFDHLTLAQLRHSFSFNHFPSIYPLFALSARSCEQLRADLAFDVPFRISTGAAQRLASQDLGCQIPSTECRVSPAGSLCKQASFSAAASWLPCGPHTGFIARSAFFDRLLLLVKDHSCKARLLRYSRPACRQMQLARGWFL